MTEKQQLIWSLYAAGNKMNDIARSLKISRQAVSKLIKKATKNKANVGGVTLGGLRQHVNPPIQPEWRYHGLHFVIHPYYFFPRYNATIQSKGYRVIYGNWVLLLHNANHVRGRWRGTVEMRQSEASRHAFQDADLHRAMEKAQDSFNKTIRQAGNRYGFCVEKNMAANVQLVREHLAYGPSGIGRAVKSHITVRGENNKVWFVMDRSAGYEHEYTEAGKVYDDQSIVEPFLNDWRNNPDMLKQSELGQILSQIIALQKTSAELHRESAAGLQTIIKLMAPQQQIEKTKEDANDYIG